MKLDKLLSGIEDVLVEIDKDLTKNSTMKLTARGDIITVGNIDSLKKILKKLASEDIDFLMLGLGANQLLKEKIEIPYIILDFKYNKELLEVSSKTFKLPASVKLSTLTSFASKEGLIGWEVFTGIPATLGGAIIMNAGTGLGEISSLVKSVQLISKIGEERNIVIDEKSFSYRTNNFIEQGDVVVSAELVNKGIDPRVTEIIRSYLKQRNDSQPMKENTCGCIFKNAKYNEQTCPVGKYIDILGIKGLQVGGMRVSSVHGNFMENIDDSSFKDVASLIELTREELYLQTGIKFELEAKVN